MFGPDTVENLYTLPSRMAKRLSPSVKFECIVYGSATEYIANQKKLSTAQKSTKVAMQHTY